MSVQIFTTRHGLIAHHAGDQVIGRSLRLYGEWAEEEIHLLSGHVCPGDTILDIGANVGSHTLGFSRLVGEAGHVIAVEAQRRAADLLAFNILMNDRRNVTRVEGLVGRGTEVLLLASDLASAGDNLGSMSFRDLLTEPLLARDVLPSALFTVDSLALSSCRLLKVDVEGMELDVLRGAERTLATHRPIVYFEQTSATGFGEIHALLRGLGYDLHWHVANPFNRGNFNGHPDNIFGGACEVNVFCIHAAEAALMPAPVALPPVKSGLYAPPPSETGLHGWSIPPDAYVGIPAQSLTSRLTIPPDPGAFVSRGEFEALAARFADLEDDRAKAQDIMSFQANVIASMSAAHPQ